MVSEGNMFNPIFKENVQGRKHPGSCAFTVPELLSYRKLKRVVQNWKKMAIKIPIIGTIITMNFAIKAILKGAHNDTQCPCDWVQLTNAQCNMVPISILWYRESWTIQLKYTFQTKQERIIVSHLSKHHDGHTNFWYVCLLERAYFT